MKNFFKNILLLVLVVALSYYLGIYFGYLYDYFSPQYDDSFFSLSKNELIFIVGIPFAYIFFTILIFKLFGFGNKKKLIIWTLAPAILFFLAGDLKHIYLPIILILLSFGLTNLLLFIKSKLF